MDSAHQRFVSSTMEYSGQLIVAVYPVLNPKNTFIIKIDLFLTFMLIKFLVRTLQIEKSIVFYFYLPMKTNLKRRML